MDRTVSDLDSIGPGPDARSSGAAKRLAGRMAALIHYDWPDSKNRRELLCQVREYSRELHHLIAAAYFEYPVEDSPGR